MFERAENVKFMSCVFDVGVWFPGNVTRENVISALKSHDLNDQNTYLQYCEFQGQVVIFIKKSDDFDPEIFYFQMTSAVVDVLKKHVPDDSDITVSWDNAYIPFKPMVSQIQTAMMAADGKRIS